MSKTWNQIFGKSGYYQSPPILLNLEGNGALSIVNWKATTGTNSSIRVFTSFSLNGGYDWSEWNEALNGSSIPDLAVDIPLNNLYLRYRAFLTSETKTEMPVLTEINFSFEPVLVINNIGDHVCLPEIWITKVNKGDISLINTSNDNEEFKFIGLNNNETVYINNEREYIESSLALTSRYKDFNDNYMALPVGKNVIKINGTAKLQFRYQFPLI